jgi:MFS family permease
MAEAVAEGPQESTKTDGRLAILLAMAMFVLVVDTSIMNVSISAVVRDIGTTVSGVQSAIALEALVSAAFILLGSKTADLIGRKRAYVLGLLAYAVGALAMTLTQSLLPIIIFWAVIGGLGASLLLPSMQSLIHGNFEGAAQKRVYATVGASAAIAAAVGPLIGGFITTFLSWRVAFLGEAVIIGVVLAGLGLVKDVAYTGDRKIDLVGGILSILGMGGLVLGILAWQEGAERVALLLAVGVVGLGAFAWWIVRQKRTGRTALIDPGLFRSALFRYGITGQMLQQIALGGTMIVLPIVPRADAGIWLAIPLVIAGCGLGLLVSQLNNYTLSPISEERVSEAAGVNSAAGSFGLSFGLAFAGAIMLATLASLFVADTNASTVLAPEDKAQVAAVLEEDAQILSDTQLQARLATETPEVQAEILRINDEARQQALQIALLVPLLAALLGFANAFRMIGQPDPEPSEAAEMMLGG